MDYKSLFEQIKTVCAWNSLNSAVIIKMDVYMTHQYLHWESQQICSERWQVFRRCLQPSCSELVQEYEMRCSISYEGMTPASQGWM